MTKIKKILITLLNVAITITAGITGILIIVCYGFIQLFLQEQLYLIPIVILAAYIASIFFVKTNRFAVSGCIALLAFICFFANAGITFFSFIGWITLHVIGTSIVNSIKNRSRKNIPVMI